MVFDSIKVVRLAHVHYAHPDLEKALAFFEDFGFVEESRREDRVFLRGYGEQPYIYVAERSLDGQRKFLGAYWVVDSHKDLEKATLLQGASPIQDLEGPGGGQYTTLLDPNGNLVGFVHGQALREVDLVNGKLERPESGFVPNTAAEKPRQGSARRFEPGPSPIHKLGHYGYMVPHAKFQETLLWYTATLNLKPSDCVYNPITGEDESVFMHIDLGPQYTDHHSFFLASSPVLVAHVHHSSFEINDFDTQSLGHDHLRNKGWTNCWGVGRHVLGSQIFDYWFDSSGNIVEHYSDGDLVNEDTKLGREAAAPNTLYVWGPNIPLAFATGKIEDAGKPILAPPDVVNSLPAQI